MHTFELESLAFQNAQVCHSHPEAVTLMRYVGVNQSYGVQDRGLGWCTYRGARRSWLAIQGGAARALRGRGLHQAPLFTTVSKQLPPSYGTCSWIHCFYAHTSATR
jgi:hypothetical protein